MSAENGMSGPQMKMDKDYRKVKESVVAMSLAQCRMDRQQLFFLPFFLFRRNILGEEELSKTISLEDLSLSLFIQLVLV